MTPRSFALSTLAQVLSSAVGADKAQEVVAAAALELGCGEQVSLEQALQIFEAIAATPGIVGVAARFGKSRLHLALSDK